LRRKKARVFSLGETEFFAAGIFSEKNVEKETQVVSLRAGWAAFGCASGLSGVAPPPEF